MITNTIGMSNTSKDSNFILVTESNTIDDGVLIGVVVFQLILTLMTGKFKIVF